MCTGTQFDNVAVEISAFIPLNSFDSLSSGTAFAYFS